jgi:hypothetical protein
VPDYSPDTGRRRGRREAFHDLVRHAAEAGAIVLEKNNGSALLLDRYVQRGMFVGGEAEDSGKPDTGQIPAMLDQLLSGPTGQNEKEGDFDVDVHVVCGRPRPPVIVEALTALLQQPTIDRLTITLHAAPQSQWWHWAVGVFRPLARVSTSESAPRTVFRMTGTVGAPPESAGNEIVRAGIGLQYVWADATIGLNRTLEEQREAITALARFGFRVPVAFYVHEGNAGQIKEWVQRVLDWNLRSGFTLYPGEYHPVSRAARAFRPLDTEVFVELASSLYRDYQFYDDVLEPPAAVWNRMKRAARIPVPLLIDEEGVVRHFHKVPMLGRSLCNVEEFRGRAPEILKTVSETREGLSTGVDARCRDCQWRYVCRGVDENRNGDPSHQRLQTDACRIWLFWLMALTWERYEIQNTAVETDLEDAPTAGAGE